MGAELSIPIENGVGRIQAAVDQVPIAEDRGIGWLTAIVGVMLFAPLIDGGSTHLPVLIIHLFLVASLGLWIIRSLRGGEFIIDKDPLLVLVGMFVGLSLLGVGVTPYVSTTIQSIGVLLMYAVWVFLLLHMPSHPRTMPILLATILGMGCFEGVLGIIQYGWLGEQRAKGTFFNPNFFAIYEVVTAAIALGLIVTMRRTTWNGRLLGLAGTAFVVAAGGVVLAQSRGAAIAMVAALLFIGGWRSARLTLLILVFLISAAVVLPNPLKHRVQAETAQNPYAYTRLAIWENTAHRIADHPFGSGLGSYKYLSFQYRFPIEGTVMRYAKRAESAHNEYLQLAAEMGLPGLAVLLIGVGLWGWEIRTVLKRPLGDWEKGAVIGLTGGVIALLVHAAVDSVFHEPSLVLLLILCGSLALSLRPPRQEKIRVECRHRPVFIAAAVVLSMLLAVFVARPAMAWFALEKGNHLSGTGQTEPASRWYQWAITIEPGNTASWDALAHIDLSEFRASGDPAKLAQAVDRITLCKELNALDPRFPARLGALYVLMANQLRDDNKKEWMMKAASDSFEQAITLDPFSPFNYAELGKIRWRQSRLDEAKDLFFRALRYEPNFLPARVLLATLASSRGQLDDARSEYETIRQAQYRYKDYPSNNMERQFLDVDLAPLEKTLSLQAGR